MFGSWEISSIRDMALAVFTPKDAEGSCNASIAFFAARRILRGVVLSSLISLSTPRACLMLCSFSSIRCCFFDLVTDMGYASLLRTDSYKLAISRIEIYYQLGQEYKLLPEPESKDEASPARATL